MEPSDIATKCTSLDGYNRVYPNKSEKKTEPPTGPLPKPPGSGLSQSLDNEAQKFSFAGVDVNAAPPPSWAPRSRTAVVGSPFGEGFASPTPRLGRVNGSFTSNGTETIGFYVDEEAVKPREFAQDAPFNRASQQSETSINVEEKKHTQEATDAPEAIASLELYDAHLSNSLIPGNSSSCKPKLSLRDC
jgi:hypothetical protein